MDTGLDLDTLAAGLLAAGAAGEGAPAAGYAPPPVGYVPVPPEVSGHEPAAAFDLYWDGEEQVYRMRAPVVATPDGEELECDFPEQLDFGKKYYCVVGVDEDGGYEAKVVPENDVDGSGYESWWKVPLFTVPHEKQEDNDGDGEAGMQYHVGAVVVGGGSGGSAAPPEPFPYGEYTAEGDEPVHYDRYVRSDGAYGGFLLDGEGKSVSGSGVSIADGDTSVWLVGVGKPKNSDGSDWHRGSSGSEDQPHHYDWEKFELRKNYTRNTVEHEEDDKLVELQLYAFSHGVVTCDYRGQFLPATSGAPVRSSVDDLGPFPPRYGADGGLTGVGDGYVQVGGFTVDVSGVNTITAGQEVVAVDVTIGSGGSPAGVLCFYSTMASLQAEQDDLDHVYVPLYMLEWDNNSSPPRAKVKMDLRRMPMTGTLETFLTGSSSGSGGS